MPLTRSTRLALAAGWLLRIVTAAGLAIDAEIHADLAHRYDPNQGSAVISQGDLFRVEAGVASLAALLILLSVRAVVWALALFVAVSALGALLLWMNYNGTLGPLPNMYEPTRYPEKTAATVAEAIVSVTAAIGLRVHIIRRRAAPGRFRRTAPHQPTRSRAGPGTAR